MHGILYSALSGSVTPSIDLTAAKTAIVDGVQSVTTSMGDTVIAILPHVLVVIGLVTVVVFGIKIFKRLTGKA